MTAGAFFLVKSFGAFAPRQLQIMALLESVYPMPMTAQAIAAEIGLQTSRYGSILHAMKLARRIACPARGVYGAMRL